MKCEKTNQFLRCFHWINSCKRSFHCYSSLKIRWRPHVLYYKSTILHNCFLYLSALVLAMRTECEYMYEPKNICNTCGNNEHVQSPYFDHITVLHFTPLHFKLVPELLFRGDPTQSMWNSLMKVRFITTSTFVESFWKQNFCYRLENSDEVKQFRSICTHKLDLSIAKYLSSCLFHTHAQDAKPKKKTNRKFTK